MGQHVAHSFVARTSSSTSSGSQSMSGLVGLCYECSEGSAGAGSGSSSVTLSACVRLQMICVWVSQGTERRDEGLFWIYVGSMKTLYPPRRPILPHNLTVTSDTWGRFGVVGPTGRQRPIVAMKIQASSWKLSLSPTRSSQA